MNLTAPIFADADKAREHLEATRWPQGPICPHCGVVDEATALKGKAHRAGLYQCNACREQFTITVGTVFERSKVPLNKWLLATYLMSSSKKGISAHQIGRTLGISESRVSQVHTRAMARLRLRLQKAITRVEAA